MATWWNLMDKLQIRAHGVRYILRFNDAENRKHIVEGMPWFYGKTMFSLALYRRRMDASLVPIIFILVWVGVFCLPPDIMTKEALYMVGATLGRIIHHDNPNLLFGARARVRLEHNLDSTVKQAPPMRFHFGEADRDFLGPSQGGDGSPYPHR
ncbi:hypothetical protein ACLB2K_050919 [Fragaria x ananassa]